MQLNVPLTGKLRLLIAGIVLLLLLAALGVFFLRGGPTPEQQRLAHLEYLVKLLEAYRNQYGFYPEPGAREETSEGFRSVWGYRPELPALASCTVSLQGSAPDPLHSVCGGNIYDLKGRVVGWKGTLTPKSGQNSVEVAIKGAGRLAAPLSEMLAQLPLDPAYSKLSALAAHGFGEYVYAVRAPEDGAQGKGGIEYQLAATVPDPVTHKLHTLIRGNYFVRSADREVMPPSLIGPGIILDRFGNPLPDQEQPLHVLLDGQAEGYPNPLIGEGEKILRFLTLRIRVKRLLHAVQSREELLAAFPDAESMAALRSTLATLRSSLEPLMQELQGGVMTAGEAREGAAAPTKVSGEEVNLDALDAQVQKLSQDLASAITAFLIAKGDEVKTVLRAEAEQRSALVQIVSSALLSAEQVQESVLLARDEIIKYLDGEGIEDQSRSRASRKIASALEHIPDLPALFLEKQLPFPRLFLSQKIQKKLDDLGMLEGGGGTGSLLSQEESEATSTGETSVAVRPSEGTGSALSSLDEPKVMVTTVTAEVAQLFMELKEVLEGVQADLESPAKTLEEIDDALRRLARALGTEQERIEGMFKEIADESTARLFLAEYESLLLTGNPVSAIKRAAEFTKQYGDFTSFLFSPALLDAVVFEKQPGIPDISAYENPLEAEYKGIPYPLP